MDVRFRILTGLIVISWGASAHRVQAEPEDTLSVSLQNPSIVPGEPVVLNVRYHLQSPLPSARTPQELTENNLRISGRVDAALSQNGEIVCRFHLWGSPAPALQSGDAQEFGGVAIGFMGCEVDAEKHEWFDRPGRYELAVVGHGTVSAPVDLTILAPRGDECGAYEIWRNVGFIPTALMILEQEGDPNVVRAFGALATEYSETPYGRYARACIGLWELKQLKERIDRQTTLKAYQRMAESKYKNKPEVQSAIEYLRSHPEEIEWLESQPAEPDWAPVLEELRRGAETFGPGHFMRQKVLFELASAQAQAKEFQAARSTLLTLRGEYGEAPLPRDVSQLVEQLDKVVERGDSAAPSDDAHQ